MGVPFLDLKRQYATIKDEVDEAVAGVFAKQAFILGESVKGLESEIASKVGTPFAIGLASGTDALLLGLRAMGLQPGDGVLTSSFTFFATAGAVWNVGGWPFFADIEPETFNLSPEAVREFISGQCKVGEGGSPVHKATGSRLRFILPVHLYGLPADMGALGEVAAEFKLDILEDGCQAFGATYGGKAVGSFGKAAAFSFFPTKNLGGAGDGGMVTTGDGELAERLLRLRVHGGKTRYIHDEIGYNSRLDELQAAVLRIKLRHVESWNRKRAEVAGTYSKGIGDLGGVVTPPCPAGRSHIYHQYVIRSEKRDELKTHLEKLGIGSMIYYPVPLHLQPCFRFLGYSEGDLPHTENAAKEVLALPIFAELTKDEIGEVISGIATFCGGGTGSC